jgi:hypothetical protein
MLANNIRRARYTLTFPPRARTGKSARAGSDEVVSARFFECSAGGTVLVGLAPRCDEFQELFGWEDSVVDVGTSVRKLGPFLRDLERQPKRMAHARRRNVLGSLRLHDWAYRWRMVLSVMGLQPLPALQDRIGKLERLAGLAERLPMTSRAPIFAAAGGR